MYKEINTNGETIFYRATETGIEISLPKKMDLTYFYFENGELICELETIDRAIDLKITDEYEGITDYFVAEFMGYNCEVKKSRFSEEDFEYFVEGFNTSEEPFPFTLDDISNFITKALKIKVTF